MVFYFYWPETKLQRKQLLFSLSVQKDVKQLRNVQLQDLLY